MNKPPFEINDNILNLVAMITERLMRLELSFDRKTDLYLRKISKVKSVNSSCAIEANSLSEAEVFDLVDGKIIMASQKEIDEVMNAYNVYENIDKFDPYNVDSFLMAHKVLTTGLIPDSGKFRLGDIGVFEGKKAVHLGARPDFVPDLIKNLFDWGKTSDVHPLIKACVIHYEIEAVHPFTDGNGRIGRLWQSLILQKYNKLFEFVPTETLVYENQQKYYNTLRQSDSLGSSTVFVEFMLEIILQTIKEFDATNALDGVKDIYLNQLSKTEMEILNQLVLYFGKNELLDIKTASNILNKTPANIRKYFRNFIKHNILISIGENKGRKYQLNKNILQTKKKPK